MYDTETVVHRNGEIIPKELIIDVALVSLNTLSKHRERKEAEKDFANLFKPKNKSKKMKQKKT